MKSFVLHIIVALILFQSMSKTVIVVDFLINQAEIARELCENRDKPQMECNGKCHLKKELEKEEKREQKNLKISAQEIVWFTELFSFQVNEPVVFATDERQHFSYSSFESYDLTHNIFHPPII